MNENKDIRERHLKMAYSQHVWKRVNNFTDDELLDHHHKWLEINKEHGLVLRQLDSGEIDLEEFIAVKGIKSLGNKLTSEKIRQVNLLEPLEYIPPKIKEVEVVEEEVIEGLGLDIPVVENVEEVVISEKQPLIIDKEKKAPPILKPKKKDPLDDLDQTKLF